jgi:hypothetical protein
MLPMQPGGRPRPGGAQVKMNNCEEAVMQASEAPSVQYGPGGEHWRDIPLGAAIVTSDGISAGTVQKLGTSYIHSRAMFDASQPDALHDLYIPLQAIYSFDAQRSVVHLNTPWEGVRQMETASPATDPLSLGTSQYGAAPAVATNPPVTVRTFTIALREQYLVATPLPHITKDVTVRRDAATGALTMTEAIRPSDRGVEGDNGNDPDGPTQSLKL